MSIPHALSLVIQRSHSLAEIFDRAVQLVAQEMRTDVCSIYLIDPQDHRLHLMATHGLEKSALQKVSLDIGEGLTGKVVADMQSLSVEDASKHPRYRYFPETREEQYHSYLGAPLAIRNRPVGAIVVQGRETRAYTQEEAQTLTTIAAQLVGVVENARLIDALDRGRAGEGYLKEVRSWQCDYRPVHQHPDDLVLRGTPASPGITVGITQFRGSLDLGFDDHDTTFRGEEEERQRARRAFDKAREEISRIQQTAEKTTDEEHAMIFSWHLMLLNDSSIIERTETAIAGGKTAQVAIYEVLRSYADQIESVPNAYVQERKEDILDLRNRLLSHLFDTRPSATMADRIIVVRGIPPSLVVEMSAAGARGIVAERGGPTSHGVLLARSLGIPAVTGVGSLRRFVRGGDTLILDGQTGSVVVAPTPATIQHYEEKAAFVQERRTAAKRFRSLPARTKDGVSIPLHANVGLVAELVAAKENGAEGVGLYRTEFPFLIREEFPTQDEQVHIYETAYRHFPNGPVHFRLLDLGADKLLPGGELDAAADPLAGNRALRLLLKHPGVLQDQVQAFARAARRRPLMILIPMLSSLGEMRVAREHIDTAIERLGEDDRPTSLKIGAMIELPAAVEITGDLARVSDFLSIGSNDLIQYSLAVGREEGELAAVEAPYHPAILRSIRRVVDAARAENTQVFLCGDMATHPALALTLTAMGIHGLSLPPTAIPELKGVLAESEVAPLAESLDKILALSDAEEIRKALMAFLPESYRDESL